MYYIGHNYRYRCEFIVIIYDLDLYDQSHFLNLNLFLRTEVNSQLLFNKCRLGPAGW